MRKDITLEDFLQGTAKPDMMANFMEEAGIPLTGAVGAIAQLTRTGDMSKHLRGEMPTPVERSNEEFMEDLFGGGQ